MTAALERGEWSAACPNRTLPLGKTRYPLYMRLGGPQGQSGQVWKISPPPPGFDPRTVQPVVSHYTDSATRPRTLTVLRLILRQSHLCFSNSPLNLAMCMHLIKFKTFTLVSWRTIHFFSVVRFSDSNIYIRFWGVNALLCWCFGGVDSLHFENMLVLFEQNERAADIKQYKFPYSVNVVCTCSLHNYRHHHWCNPLSTLIPQNVISTKRIFYSSVSVAVNWDYVSYHEIHFRFPSDF
jgi:hypothetical protein